MKTFSDLLKVADPIPVDMGNRISEGTRSDIMEMIITTQRIAAMDSQRGFSAYGPELIDFGENTTDTVFGGLSLVNRRGKMSKRVKTNLFRNFNFRLTVRDAMLVGNYIDERAEAMGLWYYKITQDLDQYIGYFGDSESCFQRGHECEYHLDALLDHGLGMALIYDADMEPYARTWVYPHYADKAMLFFNAYSRNGARQLRTRQVAGIVARDIGAETRKVDYSTDVYQNQSWAIAIGGDKTKKHYKFYLDPVSGYCEYCEENFPPDVLCHVDDYGDVCDRCRDTYFSHCERCAEFVPPDDIYPVGYDAVCEHCFDALATYCEHCETSYYNENITWVDNDPYCTDCYNALIVECARCSDELPKTNSYSEADKVYCAYCYDAIIAGE